MVSPCFDACQDMTDCSGPWSVCNDRVLTLPTQPTSPDRERPSEGSLPLPHASPADTRPTRPDQPHLHSVPGPSSTSAHLSTSVGVCPVTTLTCHHGLSLSEFSFGKPVLLCSVAFVALSAPAHNTPHTHVFTPAQVWIGKQAVQISVKEMVV